MIDCLRTRVGGAVSGMLAARLEGHLASAGDDEQMLRVAVDKIRVSLRLFVDEMLAEQVADELLRLGRL
ncbi:MAG TPA: hypothetical protein VGQ83_38055 [Polyangia bacterium]